MEKHCYQDIQYARGAGMLDRDRYRIEFYLFVVDGLAIDTGPSVYAQKSSRFYKSCPVKQVFLSHGHEDHTGMARWLQINQKAIVYLHPLAAESAVLSQPLPQYRQVIWGERPSFTACPMPETITTDRYVFECLSAPGHSLDHMILYEKNRGWLFSGDLLVNTKPFLGFFEEDTCQLIESLDRVLKMDFEVLFCAHTGPQFQAQQKIRQKRDYLLELQHKVNAFRRQGLTDSEIDQQLFPVQPSVSKLSGGEWASWHIIKTI